MYRKEKNQMDELKLRENMEKRKRKLPIFMDGIFLILMGDMRKRMICHGIMKNYKIISEGSFNL